MKYEVIKKDYKGKAIIILFIIIIILLVINFMTTRARYKEVQTFNIVKGKIYYSPSDMNLVAIYQGKAGGSCTCEDDKCVNCYDNIGEIPTNTLGYTFSRELSYCEYNDGTGVVEDETVDFAFENGGVNVIHLTKKGTKCYVYFNRINEDPVISSIVISDKTSTSFKVTVNATDNIGITSLSYTVSDGTNEGSSVNVDIGNTPVASLTKEITIDNSNCGENMTIQDGKVYTINVTVSDEDGNSVSNSVGSVGTGKAEQVLALLSGLTQGNSNVNDIIPASITAEKSSFSTIADSDEGMFRIADPMYTEGENVPYSYYWRGAVTNNWFKYGGHMWRIIRINGDGTLRLMYTGTISSGNNMTNVTVENDGANVSGTGSAIAVGTDTSLYRGYKYSTSGGDFEDPSYSGWTYTLNQLRPSGTGTPSYAKSQIEAWMADTTRGNLATDTNIVAGKFCNDRSTTTNQSTMWPSSAKPSTIYYGAYGRLVDSKAPSLGCGTYGTTGSYNNTDDGNANRANLDIYETKYGLITADEVVLAGGRYFQSDGSSNNKKYYIYNEKDQWTMSPYYWHEIRECANVFYVGSNGYLINEYVSYTYGLRPVINLSVDNLINTGSGLYNNPFSA